MGQFRFQVLQMSDSTPQEWLHVWAGRFPEDKYSENIYRELIARHESISAEDFVQSGKWKDAAKTEGKWKPNVAAVAYRIWMDAAQKLPKCPEESDVAAFLDDWSDRTYTDESNKFSQEQRAAIRCSLPFWQELDSASVKPSG
jgi:hypothetical protein